MSADLLRTEADRLQRLVDAQPNSAAARSDLGRCLGRLGQFEPAAAHFRQAIALAPKDALAHFDLGVALSNLGRREEAVASYSAAAKLSPADVRIVNNLGALLVDLGRPDEAIAWYRNGLAVAPNNVDLLDNLGLALRKAGQLAEAVASHEKAVRIAPTSARSHNNLGVALMDMDRIDDAIASCRRSVALDPSGRRAHNNLGLALKHAGQREESVASFRRALALAPNDIQSLNSLGVALLDQRRFDEAVALYEQALRVDSRSSDAHFLRAITWLLLGDFARGWAEFEWRPARPAIPIPAWNGSPLEGRTILLRLEQGFGDEIHFVRYASLVKKLGATVVLEVRPELFSLLETCPGVDRVIGIDGPTANIDVQASLGSLPGIFGTDLTNIPATVPYLHPDAALVESWRERLGRRDRLRVGFAWQGSRLHAGDRQRSVDPSRFAPLAAIPGVRLFSLQKGAKKQPTFPHIDRTEELDTFLDTAAFMKNLDLVVTVDTAVAHLAGALGVPVWVAIPYAPDWRWLLDRTDSPWYPTMWLVRQSVLDQWDDVFARIVRELETHAAGR